uniref:SGS domain-containing protein n=1 Tax=Wuchereria bancrofti TaxID=6293 RepID=A0A1I8EXR4_WUCBA
MRKNQRFTAVKEIEGERVHRIKRQQRCKSIIENIPANPRMRQWVCSSTCDNAKFSQRITEMEERTELRHDLYELRSLRSIASRKMTKSMLDEKITEIEGKIKALEAANNIDGCGDVPVLKQSRTEVASSNAVPLATVKITNYDTYIIRPVATFFLGCSEVQVNAHDVSSKNYSLIIKGLLKTINPSGSSFKQKTNLLLIMMRKSEEGNWKYLTKAEMQSKEKSTPKLDQKADPQESLMSLMKQLYDEGDDDMKRTICKAWHESQTKKNLNPDEPTFACDETLKESDGHQEGRKISIFSFCNWKCVGGLLPEVYTKAKPFLPVHAITFPARRPSLLVSGPVTIPEQNLRIENKKKKKIHCLLLHVKGKRRFRISGAFNARAVNSCPK